MPDGSNYGEFQAKQNPLSSMSAATLFAQAHGYTVQEDKQGRPMIMRGNKMVGGTVSPIHGQGYGSFDMG